MSKIAGGLSASDFVLFKQSSTISPIPAGAGLNRTKASTPSVPATDPRRRGAQPSSMVPSGSSSIRSPQARGSTGLLGGRGVLALPIPAGAGLNRCRRSSRSPGWSDPRRRGAQPGRPLEIDTEVARSPQARGSTDEPLRAHAKLFPIPAGAGLNRYGERSGRWSRPDPRRRGAQPFRGSRPVAFHSRSPQARGSTGSTSAARGQASPIPAGAGLNPIAGRDNALNLPDPRRRGAQPRSSPVPTIPTARSPQARGSTELAEHDMPEVYPIPAGAGLNRTTRIANTPALPDPRRRGAQPISLLPERERDARSPQARGSTGDPGRLLQRVCPIPAGAGLNRCLRPTDRQPSTDPRRRGAQP